ncbi:origin recognition complex subunit 3 isoform X2 [Rhineura floridana]|uniref:origin recognition complex subunit 3 isoform X2 n=1 Tax=Rhineura floridana TaxID=261503 RepID=UPI002AC800E8|nr:origin recognition complex subunit 3 isoform X2 [Rhineura floridana]
MAFKLILTYGNPTNRVFMGCFVFRPNSKKTKISSAADYFSKGNTDSEDSELRFDTCQLLWKQIKCETEQLQEDLNKKLFDNLITFLRKSHSDFRENKTEWASQMKSSEIPTAAVVLGVNVTDHDLTFKSLSEVLHDDVTPFVVSLRSKECPGIKHLLQKLTVQLMGCHIDVDSSEEEEHSKISPNRIRCSVASLIDWYRNITKVHYDLKKTDTETPCKKRMFSSRHLPSPPVVVIFKDMESFTTKVLQDFIIISSHCIHEFPLVLVFGIATSPMIIHKLLPHSVSSLLCIELFQSLSCKEHLTKAIDKLLLTSQFPFKLSEKVLQVLINIFLYHDFSVQNFIKGFQLSLLEHFYSHPLSVLCCELQEARKRVKCLSHSQCENIRRLPSFRRFVESQVSNKQTVLLTDDECLKETTQALLQDLDTYHENYFPILRCLHAFTSSLPKYPLGKQITELYCTCLEKKVWETEEYESAIQLVRMLAKDELVEILEKCVEIVASSPVKDVGIPSEKLEQYLDRFRNLEEATDDQEESISSLKELQKKTDLYHLQKTLLEMKESRRLKKLTKFEMLRFEVVDFIDGLVRNYLVPPELQTLHEVMYFSAADTLREHLNAAPRVALHTALNNPYFYLKNESLKTDAGCISNTAPDICIAYKLHLECGRLINLVDWLEAFSTVVTAAENPNSTVKDEIDDAIHARFIRAVSELELLGFIKPSKQKTDHVARLTWGSC